jgi:DNA-binding CsgD family transcriptional regulator/PAS domain-containing protein
MSFEEAALLSDIYDAALEPKRWPDVLHYLGELTGSAGGALTLWDACSDKPLLLIASRHLGADADEAYRRQYAAFDPCKPLLDAAPPCRWILCSDQFEPSVVARNEYYRDFLAPRGIRHVVAARFHATEHVSAYVAIHRGPMHPPFDQPDLQLLGRIIPHLKRATKIHCRLAEMSMEHAAGRAFLDCAGVGIVLLDASSRLLYANPTADALLDQEDGLKIVQGRLDASRSFERNKLGKLVAAAALGRDGVGAMLVGRSSGRSPLALHVVPAAMTPSLQSLNEQASVLVMLSDLAPRLVSGVRLRSLFGLTEAEAAVAQELVSGARVERIAGSRGTSVATVRTQVRSLLEKIGAESLSELVRVLNGLPRVRAD